MHARVTTAGLLAALLAASGCVVGGEDQPAGTRPSSPPRGPVLDYAGAGACAAATEWLAGKEKPSTRKKLATAVNDLAADSRSGALADKAELLIKPGVYDSNENWALAIDAFAYECDVLGWRQ